MKMRKDPLVVVVGLRKIMDALGLKSMQLSQILGLVPDHCNKIASQNCGVSIQVLCRLVKAFGPMVVEMDGERFEMRIPGQEQQKVQEFTVTLAEAGWIAKEEQDEAEELMPRLLQAVRHQDTDALVYLYEQLFCDPRYANEMLEVAFARSVGEQFHVIRDRAIEKHYAKLAAEAA